MLELKNVVKKYGDGENAVYALKGVSLTLPDSGLISILGQSGCGKTTLLNVLGGLDCPTSGEIITSGISTADFRQSDWNAYRNHYVGFVFQNYYLIPHLNVLENVKIGMKLSGLNKKEQTEKALAALESVGLRNMTKKKPRQLSGGQAQRVAIARAIANKPSIILADEPTGALDSENSVQILDILKELSQNTLVLIVTHNAELAEQYSDRIIKMKDGEVIGDEVLSSSAPSVEVGKEETERSVTDVKTERKKRRKKPTMNIFSAFGTSLKNLYHKIGRTAITSIAGCLGVISITIILGLNSGFASYAANYQRNSVSKYPVKVSKMQSNMSDVEDMFKKVSGLGGDFKNFDSNMIMDILKNDDVNMEKYTDEEKVFIEKMVTGLGANFGQYLKENDTTEFKKYVDKNFPGNYATVKYRYKITPNVYNVRTAKDGSVTSYSQIMPFSTRVSGDLEKLNFLLARLNIELSTRDINNVKSALSSLSFWDSLVDDRKVLEGQYELLEGTWPEDDAENGTYGAVLVVDKYNRITDASLYALDYITFQELFLSFIRQAGDILNELIDGADFSVFKKLGKEIQLTYDFKDFIGHEFRLLTESDYFVKGENGLYENKSSDETVMAGKLSSAPKIKISGIVRLREGVDSGCINGDIGYSQGLVDYIIKTGANSPVAVEQTACYEEYVEKMQSPERADYEALLLALTEETKSLETLTDEEKALYESFKFKCVVAGRSLANETDYKTLMVDLGVVNKDSPETIEFYPTSIESVKEIEEFIEEYNEQAKRDYKAGKTEKDNSVKFTNDLEALMASLESVVDTITYVLVAVTCLAVIVSLFMVAIIMYISVQDRTKEIGILRSMGARKIDIMNIFNTETVLLGFLSGVIGVALGYAFTPLVNMLLNKYLGIANLVQPVWWHSLFIILASITLTCLSGLFPAVFAAKKDPVTALRSE